MTSLTWRPDRWLAFAGNPASFMTAFRTLKMPTTLLHGDTYLNCAKEGYRVLEAYPEYHADYFTGLHDRLPPVSAQPPDDFKLRYIRSSIESKYARIESLLWHNAITKQWEHKEEDLFHWVLTLQRRGDDYDVLLNHRAPEWARAYIEIQRDGHSASWEEWYKTWPLSHSIKVLNALAQSHIVFNKESPDWLRAAMSETYQRLAVEKDDINVYNMTSFFDKGLRARGHASALAACAYQPNHTNMLTMVWYGERLHSTPDGIERFQAFWLDLQPMERGCLLAPWFSNPAAWRTLEARDESLQLLKILTSAPAAFDVANEYGLAMVKSCPSTPRSLELITGIFPNTKPILDMLGPNDFLTYVVQQWDNLSTAPVPLSLDTLSWG